MKKVLITANNISFIEWFNKVNVEYLHETLGCEVHIACNIGYQENICKASSYVYIERLKSHGCILHDVPFSRQPLTWQNIKAYRELKVLINTERFNLIHCHTPSAGVITRLAAREARRKHSTKVIYTAHGFHFYQGAPLKNWLLYYPVEKFMCRYTDTLVTINEEDTQLAQDSFRVNVYHMHGVGVDGANFCPVCDEEKSALRQQLDLDPDDHIILCIGELNANKNQQTLIRAASLIVPMQPKLKVLLAGKGGNEQNLRNLIGKLKLEEHVKLLGFCNDIHRYVKASDIVVSCSIREGLGLNIIEGMLAAKAVVASINRGHQELVQDGVNGFLVAPSDNRAYADRLSRLLNDKSLYVSMSQAASERGQRYAVNQVFPELEELYTTSIC